MASPENSQSGSALLVSRTVTNLPENLPDLLKIGQSSDADMQVTRNRLAYNAGKDQHNSNVTPDQLYRILLLSPPMLRQFLLANQLMPARVDKQALAGFLDARLKAEFKAEGRTVTTVPAEILQGRSKTDFALVAGIDHGASADEMEVIEDALLEHLGIAPTNAEPLMDPTDNEGNFIVARTTRLEWAIAGPLLSQAKGRFEQLVTKDVVPAELDCSGIAVDYLLGKLGQTAINVCA